MPPKKNVNNGGKKTPKKGNMKADRTESDDTKAIAKAVHRAAQIEAGDPGEYENLSEPAKLALRNQVRGGAREKYLADHPDCPTALALASSSIGGGNGGVLGGLALVGATLPAGGPPPHHSSYHYLDQVNPLGTDSSDDEDEGDEGDDGDDLVDGPEVDGLSLGELLREYRGGRNAWAGAEIVGRLRALYARYENVDPLLVLAEVNEREEREEREGK